MDIKDSDKIKFAMAVKYDSENNYQVLAAGSRENAESIIRKAEENNIPIVKGENAGIKVDFKTNLPIQVYDLVTEILSFVTRVEDKAKSELI